MYGAITGRLLPALQLMLCLSFLPRRASAVAASTGGQAGLRAKHGVFCRRIPAGCTFAETSFRRLSPDSPLPPDYPLGNTPENRGTVGVTSDSVFIEDYNHIIRITGREKACKPSAKDFLSVYE